MLLKSIIIERIKQIPFKSKDGSLYVCGNCKHRCVWYSDIGLCCEYNEDPVIKTDKRDKRAFICSHFSFIGDKQREALLRSLNLLK